MLVSHDSLPFLIFLLAAGSWNYTLPINTYKGQAEVAAAAVSQTAQKHEFS